MGGVPRHDHAGALRSAGPRVGRGIGGMGLGGLVGCDWPIGLDQVWRIGIGSGGAGGVDADPRWVGCGGTAMGTNGGMGVDAGEAWAHVVFRCAVCLYARVRGWIWGEKSRGYVGDRGEVKKKNPGQNVDPDRAENAGIAIIGDLGESVCVRIISSLQRHHSRFSILNQEESILKNL